MILYCNLFTIENHEIKKRLIAEAFLFIVTG